MALRSLGAQSIARLKEKPPAAFVFHDKAPLISWKDSVRDFDEHCPTSAAWVHENYIQTADFKGLRVRLRSDLAEGAPRIDERESRLGPP